MNQKYAPLAIFCYKRLKSTIKLLNSLKKDKITKQTIAFFFVDYPKTTKDKNLVENVIRELVKTKIFKKKKIIFRKKNLGIKKNILNGVNYVFKKFDKIIVLEDDLEVSKNYLSITNKLLEIYKKDNKIFTLTGYSLPNKYLNKQNIDHNFYSCKRPCSWGWATWKNKWNILSKIKSKKILNPNYGNDLELMQQKKLLKELDSWAFDWTEKHINNSKYCIYPKYALIKNNGDDKYSTNNFFRLKKFKEQIKTFNYKELSLYTKENLIIINSFKKLYDEKRFLYLLKKIFYETKKTIKIF
jgi:hypothetical protein